MNLEDFDYELPDGLIANEAAEPRDSSRLLVYDVARDVILHRHFRDLPDFLGANDVLVVNRSRVVNARIAFTDKEIRREGDKEIRKEIFFLKDLGGGRMEAFVKPGKWFRVGRKGVVGGLEFEVVDVLENGVRVVEWNASAMEVLEKCGSTPLPPYIKNFRGESGRYQTVYADEAGSVAAPTAGLHFTEELLGRLREAGVGFEEVVLHVGAGTFLPVSVSNVQDHVMHSEEFELSGKVAERLNVSLASGKKICAVGTTSVRVLESSFNGGRLVAGRGATEIFIYPGYEWKCVSKLITNFHLPKSTLLMLVASFLESRGVADGTAKVKEIYEVAIKEGYRFYSLGDGMILF